MSLYYILEQVGRKMGLNPQDAGQRKIMLLFINPAAKEIYDTCDMAGCLREQYFKVNPNQEIAFPPYVGQLRAMRQAFDHIAIKLSQMRPRYNQYSWEDEWNNWRIKGPSCLQQSVHNQSLLTISVPEVESPAVVVNVVGSTTGSSRVAETIIMSSTTATTVNSYTDVFAFTKSGYNNYDVALQDIDGNQISYISNNRLKAEFQLVDIATAPWILPNTNPLLGWVEVLYKEALSFLFLDTDEFPAQGYDDVIINKSLQLWAEEQKDIQTAMAYNQKCTTLLAQIHENANRGTDDRVAFVDNPHDRMMPRVGFGRDFYQAYRIIGR